jgi:hypothetical protein
MYRFIVRQKLLFAFFAISVFVVVAFEFFYIDQVELFTGGAKFADISVNLSLAYLSAFIFYVVTIYLPENSKRKRSSELALKTTNRIVFSVRYFFMRQDGGYIDINGKVIPTFEDISDWTGRTNFYSDAPIATSPTTKMKYVEAIEKFLVKETMQEIDKASFYGSYFEHEYMESLYALRRSKLIEFVTRHPPQSLNWVNNPYIAHYNNEFEDFLILCENLVSITQKHYGVVKI